MHISFLGLLIVDLIAFAAPLLLDLLHARRVAGIVIEIVAGIIVGPAVLGWVRVDTVIGVLATIGLGALLFLAGIEVDLNRLKGSIATHVGLAFLLSFGLALLVSYILYLTGLLHFPLLVAIILVSTSLGVVVPILKDAGESESELGQLIIASATVGEFGSMILLSFFFSSQAPSFVAQVALLLGFAALAVLLALCLFELRRYLRYTGTFLRLQNTSAQITIRAAILMLVASVTLAQVFGLQAILGAFLAGVILRGINGDRVHSQAYLQFHQKLEAIGYGVFVPVFFVVSGLNFDLAALLASPTTMLLVPIFFLALLFVRGLPAILYRKMLNNRNMIVAGLLQSTSLTFIVAATEIGKALGLLTQAVSAALVTAGMLSVLIFPLIAMMIMKKPLAESQPALAKASEG